MKSSAVHSGSIIENVFQIEENLMFSSLSASADVAYRPDALKQ